MLRSLKVFFDALSTGGTHEASRIDEAEDAVAALLVKAATLDDTFGTEERRAIEALLASRFASSPDEASKKVDAALTGLEKR